MPSNRTASMRPRDATGIVAVVTALHVMTVMADGRARHAGTFLALMAFSWLAVARESKDRPQELRRTVRMPGTGWPLCSRKTLDVVGTALTFCLWTTASVAGPVEVRVAAAVLGGGMVLAGVATGWNADRIDDIGSKVFGAAVVVMLASGVLGIGLLAFDALGGGVDIVWIGVFFLLTATVGGTIGEMAVCLFVVARARELRDGRERSGSREAIGAASPVKGIDQPV